MGEWISIKDRLPDYETPVLAAVLEIDSLRYFKIVAVFWKSNIWSGILRDQVVTHWMPLPESPK